MRLPERVVLATNNPKKLAELRRMLDAGGVGVEVLGLADLARYGARCFLIGESLMRQADVAAATRAILSRPLTAQGGEA